MRCLVRNSLVIALVLVLIAAATSVAAFQPAGTPEAGTPSAGTPVVGTPIVGTPIGTSAEDPAIAVLPSSFLAGLPSATPGAVTVIAVSRIQVNDAGEGFAVAVVANGTDQPVSGVSISGAVRDTTGNLTAAGSSDTSLPSIIQPGGVGQSLLTFQGNFVQLDLPTVEVRWGPVPTYVSGQPLRVTEANLVGGDLIGFVENTGQDASYSGFALASCFDAANSFLTFSGEPIEDTSLEPGQLTAFTIAGVPTACAGLIVSAGSL